MSNDTTGLMEYYRTDLMWAKVDVEVDIKFPKIGHGSSSSTIYCRVLDAERSLSEYRHRLIEAEKNKEMEKYNYRNGKYLRYC